jgi:hypothetical protein
LLHFIIILVGLGLVIPLPSGSAQAAQAEISDNSSQVLLAQRRRRRRRKRGVKPPVKSDKKVDKAEKEEPPKAKKKVNKLPAKTSKGKKRRRLKKAAKTAKKAPKVAQAKGPFLPKNFGRILIYSGAGVALLGGGVAALGANMHNAAVTEREVLQAREASNEDQRQLFYSLHADMESAKLVHYAGLGLSGLALFTAAIGSFL